MYTDQFFQKFILPDDLTAALKHSRSLYFPQTKEELTEMCCGPAHAGLCDVSYRIEGLGLVKEAEVLRCKNGTAVNFTEDYMRRRDPDCMRIGDGLPSDKPRFSESFGYDFSVLRAETFAWLAAQPLILLPFKAGGRFFGYDALMICPVNAAFFALALAGMQGFTGIAEVPDGYSPRGIIYVAPPFRHTHFNGRQVVVHCRSESVHEIFSYNLYPGPSAKKGVFSMLLDIGEREGWITNHASAALLESPYENRVVFMHEGASGGGKSEMLEEIHREADGRVLLGRHLITGEKHFIKLQESSRIYPIADDMVLAKRDFQNGSGRLMIADGEDGWFLRMDGERGYGSNPLYERISIHPPQPLEFFNMYCVPDATCLIWEHTPESDGRPCSNPRVIIPRELMGSLPGGTVQAVDVRSFGVRMPPSTAQSPSCGVMGMIQLVPASLAWLWRLVSPRGYKNPSVNAGEDTGSLQSEGVGSYWPFDTGRRVTQANLLLHQLLDTPATLELLIPNQHVGAYEIGFAGQWLVREYLARRGGKLNPKHLVPARCPLFGYSPNELKIDGQYIRRTFLHPEQQSCLGAGGYDAGAQILTAFFKRELAGYLCPELDPLGREIINVCLKDGGLEDYLDLTPMK